MGIRTMAFVAYSSRVATLAKMIVDGVAFANAKSDRLRYEPWEFNDIGGRPLTSPIIKRIKESAFIVADITFLNPNVVYEIGVAIGNRKRVFLVRHRNTPGDKLMANEAGIFDTLGFKEFDDADDLCHMLTSHIEQESLPFGTGLDRHVPVYVVEPLVKGQAETTMTSRLKKARYRYRSFNPIEDVRLSAVDAIRQVSVSSGVLVSLQDHATSGGNVHNVRSLFVAGLANGMEKPTLILCSTEYNPPLDVRDEVKRYRQAEEISEHINNFSLEITDYMQQADPVPIDAGTLLQSLSIGDPTAENEMATLAKYYLPIDQYDRTVRGDVNLVVGRKGSGKTALFIQVRDRIRADKRNIVVDLKPEGYQLIKFKEQILEYLTEGARQHLITAFWEYLLLLEVAYKLLEKDRNTYKHNHEIYGLYVQLEATYKVEDFSSGGDFSERLFTLSQRISDSYRAKYGDHLGQKLSSADVSELVYGHDIRELREKIGKYLERKQSVWVLFDNLDKGWSTNGIDDIDAIILRCLVDAGRKLERDMRRVCEEFHCIIFIRNDVYEHLMQNSADYGKEMRVVLDWTDPELLREMLRLRLVSMLGKDKRAATFEQIWTTICVSHYKGEETSSYMIDRSLMRPQNFLKIFSHIRGFANNFNHPKICEEDIEKGMLSYSHDLLIELDRELTDVFPAAKDVLYNFIDAKSVLSVAEIECLFETANISTDMSSEVIDFLLYYGVIGLHSHDEDLYIYNVNYDPKMLRIRAQRTGATALYVINPAFWPALGIQTSPTTTGSIPQNSVSFLAQG